MVMLIPSGLPRRRLQQFVATHWKRSFWDFSGSGFKGLNGRLADQGTINAAVVVMESENTASQGSYLANLVMSEAS